MSHMQSSWEHSNENENKKIMEERKESETFKEIPPLPSYSALINVTPSPSTNDKEEKQCNDNLKAFALKRKERSYKSYDEGSTINRTEKHMNVDQSMASKLYCNEKGLQIHEPKEIRKQCKGKKGELENIEH